MDLVITIDWPYEKTDALAREYYKLTNQYKYDDSVIYYKLVYIGCQALFLSFLQFVRTFFDILILGRYAPGKQARGFFIGIG